MFTLTREQKIENVKELLESKRRKLTNLAKEIKELEKKHQRLEDSPVKDISESFEEKSEVHELLDWRKEYSTYAEVAPSLRHLYTPEK